MRILESMGLARVSEVDRISRSLTSASTKLENLEESQAMAQLELSREDLGWQKISENASREFTREGLARSAELARVYAVANPLIKRALALRAAYVFGQGVGTTAKGDGSEGSQDVNGIIQEWLDDPEVREVFAGAQAQERNEGSLGTDGNVFFALFTSPLDGRVRPRLIDFDEIAGKLSDPEDKLTTWYYKRTWTETSLEGKAVEHSAYHPDLNYRPRARTRVLNDLPVLWDAPIYHVKVNAMNGWKFGIGDAYAALPWARGYKEFLEDWALLMKSLAKIAWRNTSGKKSAAQQARQATSMLKNLPAGSTSVGTDDNTLEAVPKSGATLDSESAKPLAAMVATSMGIPVTMLLSDPGQTGARAVAETLDRPTRLEMLSRQEVWREARRQILNYVINQSALAPRGTLRGTGKWDGDRIRVEFPKVEDVTLTITFPELEEIPIETIVDALVKSDETGKVPPLLIAEQIMRALKIRDVDEWLETMKDGEGNFLDQYVSAGQTAVDDFRAGKDPADTLK